MYWTILRYVLLPLFWFYELCIQKWYIGFPVILASIFVMFIVMHNFAHMLSD